MSRMRMIGVALAFAIFVVIPATAYAETQTLVSSASNSLCINPKPGFTQNEELSKGTGTGEPFPEGASNCEATPTHAIPVPSHSQWKGVISGAEWVGIEASGEDGGAPERYYIYNVTFTLCEKQVAGSELNGTMFADNQAGAFLNGEPIGNQKRTLATEHQNFSGPPAGGFPFGGTHFKAGLNTLQFVVYDEGGFTGIDFKATVTSPSCSSSSGPHWYRNGVRIPEGEKVQTMTWGRIGFTPANGGAPVECKKADAEDIENPVGGGAGVDKMVLFNPYECVDEECSAAGGELRVEPFKLPWATELIEPSAGLIQDRMTGIELVIGCWSGPPTGPGNVSTAERGVPFALITAEGELRPQWRNGTSTGKPSRDECRPPGNELNGGEFGHIIVTCTDKMLGFLEEELITVKNP